MYNLLIFLTYFQVGRLCRTRVRRKPHFGLFVGRRDAQCQGSSLEEP